MDRSIKASKIIQYKKAIDGMIHIRHHELAEKYDLSLEQYHLLIELDELMLEIDDNLKSAPTIGELAQYVNNSQNTLSEKITRLVKKGLVQRVKDNEDRRVSRVVPTSEGQKLIEEISSQASSKFLSDSILSMDEDLVDKLLISLEALMETMKKSEKGI